jgi:two-component system sensor histidine kinase EvgS
MKSEPKSVYYKALEDWMEKPPKVIVSPYLFWAITGFSGMLAFAFAFILLLRWQIRLKVQKMTELNKILKESETKFKDLFNKHSAVKLLLDPDHGNIVEANQAAEKFYGWPGEKIRQMRIQDINTMPAEWVKAKMKEVKSLGRTHFEFQHRLADGSIRNVEVFTSNIDIRGKTFLHSIIHDITKRKQAEKERERLQLQFIQAQKMESVGRLAGGVAHDYNNMLNIILGYAEMALGKTDPTDSLHADLKEILDAAKRSVSITRHLLAFAREQVVLPPVALDLNDAVENMLKMLQRLVGENIDMVWQPSVGLWAVEMDPSQVDQILVNLCVNARDAIVEVGTITIETRNRVFDEAYCAIHSGFVPGEYVLLIVSDDGCGINKNVLDHIFEPFFTTKPTGKGTGLGLATVYGIVKQNNGFVNVYSESEEGTIFKLYFPRHKGKVTNFTAENVEEIPLGHGEKILLVEDDPAILELGKNMLKKLGYQVLETVSPREAIRMFEEYRSSIALLITDIIMPEINGHDLAGCLHVFDPDLKVLFMSGYTANTVTCHGRVLDKKLNFLEKPFTFKDLAVNVHKALGHKREIESGTKKDKH